MHSEKVIDTARLCRRISNERSKNQRLLKFGKPIRQQDIDKAQKWGEKYGQYLRDNTVPPTTTWVDASLVEEPILPLQ
jgi:hypothetical protein